MEKTRRGKYIGGVDVSIPIQSMGDKGRIRELVQRRGGGRASRVQASAAGAIQRIQGVPRTEAEVVRKQEKLIPRSFLKTPGNATMHRLEENPFEISEEVQTRHKAEVDIKPLPDASKILQAYARLKAKEMRQLPSLHTDSHSSREIPLESRTVEDKISRSVAHLLGELNTKTGTRAVRSGRKSTVGICGRHYLSPLQIKQKEKQSQFIGRVLPVLQPVTQRRIIPKSGFTPDKSAMNPAIGNPTPLTGWIPPPPLSNIASTKATQQTIRLESQQGRSLREDSCVTGYGCSLSCESQWKSVVQHKDARRKLKSVKLRHYKYRPEVGGVALEEEEDETEYFRTALPAFIVSPSIHLNLLLTQWKAIDELCRNCVHYDDVTKYVLDLKLIPFPNPWLVNERIRERGSGIFTFGRYLLLMIPHIPMLALDRAVREELCLATHSTIRTADWLKENTGLCTIQEEVDEDNYSQFFDMLYQHHMSLWVNASGFSAKPELLRQLYQLYDRYRDEDTKKGISFRRFHRQFRSTLSDYHLKNMFLSAQKDDELCRDTDFSMDGSVNSGRMELALGAGGGLGWGYLNFKQYATLLWPGFSGEVQVDVETAAAINALALSTFDEGQFDPNPNRTESLGPRKPKPAPLLGVKDSTDIDIFRMFDRPPEAH